MIAIQNFDYPLNYKFFLDILDAQATYLDTYSINASHNNYLTLYLGKTAKEISYTKKYNCSVPYLLPPFCFLWVTRSFSKHIAGRHAG